MSLMSFDKLHLRTPLKSVGAWAAAIGLLLAWGPPSVVQAQKPDDGNGGFRTGRYRDLFAEQAHSPEETKAKIEKAFQQLFHGDAATERVYFEAGANANGPLAYITDWANNDARSEGMSYGMMIAVQMDKKHEFDALWNWSNTYMLITDPKNPNVGYFAWSMNTDGTPRATGPAPDGEEYYAMALLFAARRWGNGRLRKFCSSCAIIRC
jgi:oligosaccharide reducing-end xylanase